MTLSSFVPQLIYYMRWELKEKFANYEDVHQKWLMFIVEDGSFYYEIGSDSGTASFGDLVICPPGIPFRRVVVSPVTLHVVFIEWSMDGEQTFNQSELNQLPSGKRAIRDAERMRSNFKLLEQADGWVDHSMKSKQAHYIRDIWLLYCREAEGWDNPKSHHLNSIQSDPLVNKAVSIIKQQAFGEMSLAAIAESLGTNSTMLCKKFSKVFGITPIQYATALRLEKAKSLLLETALNLDQISDCCGYTNGFYLNRVFTKHMNVTPIQFRLAHRV